jgi:hypothetical protein
MVSRKRKLEDPNPYPVRSEFAVSPSKKGRESQYEAYQSIYTALMYSHYPPKPGNQADSSAYELLCFKNNISIIPVKDDKPPAGIQLGRKVVFFKQAPVTHYKAINSAGMVLNPYVNLQPKDTQGFCQTFAFLLANNMITPEFQLVSTIKPKIDVEEFNKFAINTQLCCRIGLKIINSNPDIKAKFKRDFDLLNKKQYGIVDGTTVDQYLQQFSEINEDIATVKYYIYDQPLRGWPQGAPKEELWGSFVQGGKRKNKKSKTKRRKFI